MEKSKQNLDSRSVKRRLESQQAEFNYTCDLCAELGDTELKKCKVKFGVICCKECFLEMKETER